MNCTPCEPTLSDALADPVITAMMEADGVDPRALESNLGKLARTLARERRECGEAPPRRC